MKILKAILLFIGIGALVAPLSSAVFAEGDPVECLLGEMNRDVATAEHAAKADVAPVPPPAPAAPAAPKSLREQLAEYPNSREQMKAIASGKIDIPRPGPMGEVQALNKAGLKYNMIDPGSSRIQPRFLPQNGDVVYVPSSTSGLAGKLGSDYNANGAQLNFVKVRVEEDGRGNYKLTPVDSTNKLPNGDKPGGMTARPNQILQWYEFPKK